MDRMTEVSIGEGKEIDGVMNVVDHFDWGNPRSFILENLSKQRIVVAKDGEKIIGYLLYQVLWGNQYMISLIQIMPDYQQQGIGMMLAKKFEEILHQKGIKEYISSSTNTPQKIGAYKFHLKIGMKEIGKLDMIHGEEIFYSKKL